MIVTNKFLFIHLPKTGGTFVTKMLLDASKAVPELRAKDLVDLKHSGVRKIPDEYKALPVVINIRNVFEHYVSRYTFKWWRDPKQAERNHKMDLVKQVYPHFPELSFSEYLHFVNDWRFRNQIGARLQQLLTERNFGSISWMLARLTQMEPMKFVRNLPEMTDDELRADYAKFRFLRTESLNDDLYNLLVESGAPGEKINFILEQKPILPKRGGRGVGKETWREYFSDEDIAFVMQREAMLFKIFPYMIPGE